MEILKSFTKKNPNLTILEFFEVIKDTNTFTKNYYVFLKTLGEFISPQHPTTLETVLPNYKETLDVFTGKWTDTTCHILSAYVVTLDSSLNYYFGFMDELREDGTYGCNQCHSFLLSKDKSTLYDPYLEYAFPELFSHRTNNYFGVYIPLPIVEQITHNLGEEKRDNVSGLIKECIFVSEQLTIEFIELIKEYRLK